MAVTTPDTHQVANEMLAAGFTGEQAEAVTRVVRRSQDIDLSNLATKADLAATKAGLAAVRSDLQIALGAAKTETLKWLIGSIGIQTVVILGTVVALMKTPVH